jgi:hypothetical protein
MAAVRVCPAIVAIHVCAAPLFSAAAILSVAVPLPDDGDTVSAGVLVVAAHAAAEHPAGDAVSVTAFDPPLCGKDKAVSESENAHATFTVTVCRPVNPDIAAVMSALPIAMAAIWPLEETVTFVGSDDDHCAADV